MKNGEWPTRGTFRNASKRCGTHYAHLRGVIALFLQTKKSTKGAALRTPGVIFNIYAVITMG